MGLCIKLYVFKTTGSLENNNFHKNNSLCGSNQLFGFSFICEIHILVLLSFVDEKMFSGFTGTLWSRMFSAVELWYALLCFRFSFCFVQVVFGRIRLGWDFSSTKGFPFTLKKLIKRIFSSYFVLSPFLNQQLICVCV